MSLFGDEALFGAGQPRTMWCSDSGKLGHVCAADATACMCICRAGRGRLGAGLGTGVAVFGVWRLHPEMRFERSEERDHCDFSCDVCSCTVMCGALCINWSIILLEVVHRRTRVTTDIRLKRRMSIRCQESRMTCARPGSGVCLPVCGVRET